MKRAACSENVNFKDFWGLETPSENAAMQNIRQHPDMT